MYYGLGVVVTYTRNTLVVEIDNKNQDFDSEEIRLGAILQLALIKKIFTNYAIKIDGRYTYDSDPYYSGAVSFMMPY
jgi:hypothetical protein